MAMATSQDLCVASPALCNSLRTVYAAISNGVSRPVSASGAALNDIGRTCLQFLALQLFLAFAFYAAFLPSKDDVAPPNVLSWVGVRRPNGLRQTAQAGNFHFGDGFSHA